MSKKVKQEKAAEDVAQQYIFWLVCVRSLVQSPVLHTIHTISRQDAMFGEYIVVEWKEQRFFWQSLRFRSHLPHPHC